MWHKWKRLLIKTGVKGCRVLWKGMTRISFWFRGCISGGIYRSLIRSLILRNRRSFGRYMHMKGIVCSMWKHVNTKSLRKMAITVIYIIILHRWRIYMKCHLFELQIWLLRKMNSILMMNLLLKMNMNRIFLSLISTGSMSKLLARRRKKWNSSELKKRKRKHRHSILNKTIIKTKKSLWNSQT